MIVSTDQQAFSVTIQVKAEEGGERRESEREVDREGEREGESEGESRLLEGGCQHQSSLLQGLAGLREQGLLLDTWLWGYKCCQVFCIPPHNCVRSVWGGTLFVS